MRVEDIAVPTRIYQLEFIELGILLNPSISSRKLSISISSLFLRARACFDHSTTLASTVCKALVFVTNASHHAKSHFYKRIMDSPEPLNDEVIADSEGEMDEEDHQGTLIKFWLY